MLTLSLTTIYLGRQPMYRGSKLAAAVKSINVISIPKGFFLCFILCLLVDTIRLLDCYSEHISRGVFVLTLLYWEELSTYCFDERI